MIIHQSDYESVWLKINNEGDYELNNIPFYVYGVSKGDVLAFQKKDEFVVSSILKNNGHSTMSIYMNVKHQKNDVIYALQLLGGFTNSAITSPLFSLDIPSEVSFAAIDRFLKEKMKEGILDYEDVCLQHAGIDTERIKQCKALIYSTLIIK
ncbi:DUF4265 domain-containing protein, partial [Cronobacter sakazakii]|uniref:DUF4265 domain-containing protein n=1 Tax=Cronobacter sakazakii TaxID=28141 RepID=UPI001F3CB1F4